MIKLSNVLLASALLLTLTACGGSSSTTTISTEDKEASIEKISNYAEDSSIPPEKQDYINAGVDSNDLNFVDIDELNSLVATKNSTEVDSEEELNVLAHSIMDTTAPIITLKGDSVLIVPLNKNYTDAGATAIDNKDGEVEVQMTGVVDTSSEGTYNLTYEASDRFSNTATVTRIVNVVEEDIDTEAPTLTIVTSIKEQGDLSSIVTAVDNIDGDVDVTISGETNTSIVGVHTVIYSASDSAGNEVRKEVAITVIPFTITELFSKSKELNDVSYLVVGDSTRYYEGVNDVLINSRDSDEGYYKDLLSPKSIKFMHTSIEGQIVEYWLNNQIETRNGGDSFTITDTLAKIGLVNPNHCIVEFSMGINDDLRIAEINKVKENIEKGILALKHDYPNVKILLVSPVPYYKFASGNNSYDLNSKYEELKVELNLPFVSGFDILDVNYPENTIGDYLHPNKETSKILVNEIFEQIENDSLN